MEKILQWIEKIREAPEATRKLALVAVTTIAIIIIGAAWVTTLSWQFKTSVNATTVEEETATELPGIGELFSRGGAQVSDSLKGALRNFLLRDDDETAQPIQEPSQGPAPVRLPSR